VKSPSSLPLDTIVAYIIISPFKDWFSTFYLIFNNKILLHKLTIISSF